MKKRPRTANFKKEKRPPFSCPLWRKCFSLIFFWFVTFQRVLKSCSKHFLPFLSFGLASGISAYSSYTLPFDTMNRPLDNDKNEQPLLNN